MCRGPNPTIGVPPKRVNVAASNHESRPPTPTSRPTAADASSTVPMIGWSGGTSNGGMSIVQRTDGGCSFSHGSACAASVMNRSNSASTAVPQPPASALPGR